jgi:hypothetical protein
MTTHALGILPPSEPLFLAEIQSSAISSFTSIRACVVWLTHRSVLEDFTDVWL